MPASVRYDVEAAVGDDVLENIALFDDDGYVSF